MRREAGMRQSGGWKSTGGGQTGVVEHRGCRSELCAGAVGVCQASRSSRLYCDEEARLAQDSHWIAEPRGSERSTRGAVQVAVRRAERRQIRANDVRQLGG